MSLVRVQLGEPRKQRQDFCPVSVFFVLTNWTRKADKENNLNGCFPAVALPCSLPPRLAFAHGRQHSCLPRQTGNVFCRQNIGGESDNVNVLSFILFVFHEWTRKADKENNLNGCFPAVARQGESNLGSQKN